MSEGDTGPVPLQGQTHIKCVSHGLQAPVPGPWECQIDVDQNLLPRDPPWASDEFL